MAIHYEDAPITALAAVKLNLSPSLDEVNDLTGVIRVLRPRRIQRPFQIYTARLEDVLTPQPTLLRAAKLTGWYYVIFIGDEIDSVSEIAKGRLPRYASRRPAGFAKVVRKVVEDAEKLEAVKQSDYLLRILNVPEVYFSAVWLHSSTEDLLLPIPPIIRALREGQTFSEKQVVEALKPIAQLRLATPDDAPPMLHVKEPEAIVEEAPVAVVAVSDKRVSA